MSATYNNIQIKMGIFKRVNEKRKQALMEEILDLISNNIIGNKAIDEIEQFFAENAKV